MQKLRLRIQADTNHGNTDGMYTGIKQTTGPIPTKCVPLKTKTAENITDLRKQIKRWVEHYLELFSKQNVVTEAVLNAISQLTIMEELDEQPMEEQPSKAINCPSAGKATGEDGIPLRLSSMERKH